MQKMNILASREQFLEKIAGESLDLSLVLAQPTQTGGQHFHSNCLSRFKLGLFSLQLGLF